MGAELRIAGGLVRTAVGLMAMGFFLAIGFQMGHGTYDAVRKRLAYRT